MGAPWDVPPGRVCACCPGASALGGVGNSEIYASRVLRVFVVAERVCPGRSRRPAVCSRDGCARAGSCRVLRAQVCRLECGGEPRRQSLHYLRVVVGESFTPRDLRDALVARDLLVRSSSEQLAVHLDLGHVPPFDCNTFLFQLLLEGRLR